MTFHRESGHTPSSRMAWLVLPCVERAVVALPALRCLPAYALRSAVGTLSLSTSATEQLPGLFSCTFVGIKAYWLVCVMNVDNELLRVSVEAVADASLKCVLCLCLCRTASERN